MAKGNSREVHVGHAGDNEESPVTAGRSGSGAGDVMDGFAYSADSV